MGQCADSFYCCRSTNTSPELQQFPQLNKKKSAMAAAMTSRLKGDPAFLIGDAGEPQNQEEGEAPFCELDRLAYIVEEIDHATSVVPLGAYIVSPMHQVIANPSFHGLTWDQSLQLYNFFHFRHPDLPERAQIIENAEGLVRAGDFFDPLIQDLDGAWVISRTTPAATRHYATTCTPAHSASINRCLRTTASFTLVTAGRTPTLPS